MLLASIWLSHFCIQTGNSISMLFCFHQVQSKDRREIVPRDVSHVVPPSRRKWLNIVFDLNGILCQCALKSYAAKMKPYQLEDNVLCHKVPTIIGPKAVFARQNVPEFLREVSRVANRIVVWTSMFKSNAEPIAGHIFSKSKAPFDILAQEQCKKVEMSKGIFHSRGDKYTLLKILSEQLFCNPSGDTSFNKDNTLLIDDSPEKSLCNEKGNAIFLDTWGHGQRRDNFLLEILLAWLWRLDSDCKQGGLREYVEANRIGKKPLDESHYYVRDIFEGMRESAENLCSRFELPGLGLVIEPCHRRT
jgi:NLI interacting factor-like phosphatase